MSQRLSPLANRVDPFGRLHAVSARGSFMGNRGGRIHDPATRLPVGRAFASRRWIICVLCFRGRQRSVWGAGYTELFFLDEPTALAAGHRPCFECRREAADRFREAFPRAAGSSPPRADAIDRQMHGERRAAFRQQLSPEQAEYLPDGAMISVDGAPAARRDGRFLRWRFDGYGAAIHPAQGLSVHLLTPASTVAALRSGYIPEWA